jgi:acyl-homoserine lactone acylase PvdQ
VRAVTSHLSGLSVRSLVVAGLIACAAIPAAAAAEAPVQPYGANDAGGFRNVLPAGENGFDNAKQLAEFEVGQGKGETVYPPHFADQLPLYANLLYASPTLTHAQIPLYYKDATFGVKPGEIASIESPRSDVTIERDSEFGVPHVYATTRGGLMFGAGYAAGEDRLFFIDVVRHTGRAELASFAGGAEGNRVMDRVQYSFAPYSEADLEFQVKNAATVYGTEGERALADAKEYLAGLNAYIELVKLNPSLLPAEYAGIGKSPEPFKLTDLVAEASLIGGLFGSGGGGEVRSAQALEALEKRFGMQAGRAAWSDLREANDPEAPTTVQQAFPYGTGNPFAPKGLALPDAGSISFTPPAKVGAASTAASASAGQPLTRTGEPIPQDGSIGARLLHQAGHESNWELVNAAHSITGHPIAVMGPQVGYYVPEVLMEEDLHGPGIDARGAAFPGGNQMIQLGHGRSYAWSATSGEAGDTHTFAEVLCKDQVHYLYKGQCLAMEKIEHTNKWTPNANDKTPAGEETLVAYRTVHGIVYARGTVKGKPVAFVNDRTTYFHEADSVIGLMALNEPGVITSPKRFGHAVSKINFGFNWAYVDGKNIAYYMSGWYPLQAAGTSPEFPVFGTGKYDYRGFEPKLHKEKVLPFKKRPHALNPAFEISWNNKPAPGFAAATNKYAWGPVYRQQLIRNFVEADIVGGKKMGLEQLISAMDEAATQDIRMVELWPIIKQLLGSPSSPALKTAIAELEEWAAAGGHRRDLANTNIAEPGTYEHNPAITIMDAWWPKLVKAEFEGALGSEAFGAIGTLLRFGGPYPGKLPEAPEFQDAWYGHVSKDLRDVLAANALGPSPAAPYSRIYCGGGSLEACRAALAKSLEEALAVTPVQIYGEGGEANACSKNPQASCFDMNRWTEASAIKIPPFPFQNRPTFQQTVEITTTPTRGRTRARARPRPGRRRRSGSFGSG